MVNQSIGPKNKPPLLDFANLFVRFYTPKGNIPSCKLNKTKSSLLTPATKHNSSPTFPNNNQSFEDNPLTYLVVVDYESTPHH